MAKNITFRPQDETSLILTDLPDAEGALRATDEAKEQPSEVERYSDDSKCIPSYLIEITK